MAVVDNNELTPSHARFLQEVTPQDVSTSPRMFASAAEKQEKLARLQRLKQLQDEKARREREVLYQIELRKQNKKAAWLQQPQEWVQGRLQEHLWSKQVEIFESVRDNRFTAVKSCHGAGKSFSAARLVAWWLDCFPPGEAFVVTSAPTYTQVKNILWREIGKAFSRASEVGDKLPGRINKTEWYLPGPGGSEELVAFGRKPSDYDPSAFQGIHARRVLVVLDEAGGIPRILYEAAYSLTTGPDCRILAIGNPTDITSEFARVCEPTSGWNTIKISAFDTPNFTGEEIPEQLRGLLISPQWVEEMKQTYGEDSPAYLPRVLAEFPDQSEDSLIPLGWIERAKGTMPHDKKKSGPFVLSADIAREGSDSSVIASRIGNAFRIDKTFAKQDTMATTGHILQRMAHHGIHTVNVDEIGVGGGVVDRLKEQGVDVNGVNVARSSSDKGKFLNLRAELYWKLREMFEKDEISIPHIDEETVAELIAIKYKITSAGKIQIESKDETRKRLGRSPDRADSFALLCYEKKARPRVRVVSA